MNNDIERAIEMLKDRMKLSDKNRYEFSYEECKLAKVAITALEEKMLKKPTLNDVEKAIELIAIGKGRFLDRHDIYAAMQDGIEALEKQLNGGWIPCSKKLPTSNGVFEVTIKNSRGKRHVAICNFNKDSEIYEWGGKYDSPNVIAWRSRPEPYKEVENNV